jgi:hypothetical protein
MKYLNLISTNLILNQKIQFREPPKIYIVDFKKLDELKKLKNTKQIKELEKKNL